MNMLVANNTLQTALAVSADGAAQTQPTGLAPELQQRLDAVARVSMLRVPVAVDQAVPLGHGQGVTAWDGPPTARIGVAVQPQTQATDKLAMPEQAWLHAQQQEAVWSQPAVRQQPFSAQTQMPPQLPAPTQEQRPEQPTTMSQLDVVAVLQRNEGLFKKSKSGKDMQRLIDNPNTSPELRTALRTIMNDPELKARLDSAKQGRTDGKIGLGDIRVLSKSPEVIEHNRMKAESFKHNYIPSDVSASGEMARRITANDAMRELYKYSDNLPKKTSLKDLQAIVDGTGHQNKRPPQLVAAAQYMLDNPEAWKSLTGKEGEQRISRAGLCDALGRNVQMSASANKALDTIEKNAKDFFDGKTFDRNKLHKIIDDPASKPDNVAAAKKLLDDPVLFGMLDNAKRGHKSSGWRTSDDGKVGRKDLLALREKMNKTQAPEHAARAAASGAFNDPIAVNEMRNGQLNQPDTKTVKGGGLKKFVSGAMKVYSTFQKISSEVMGAIAALKIPLVSQAAAVSSMVSNAISGGLDIARTAINDGNVKLAAAKAALSFGSQAISVATAPGAGKVATVAGREIVNVAVKKAAKETGKEVVGEIAQSQGEQFLNDRRSA